MQDGKRDRASVWSKQVEFVGSQKSQTFINLIFHPEQFSTLSLDWRQCRYFPSIVRSGKLCTVKYIWDGAILSIPIYLCAVVEFSFAETLLLNSEL